MFTRTSSATLLLLLGACGRPADDAVPGDAEAIACRPAGAAAYAKVCTVDRPTGPVLVVRNPDGGFHRLRIAHDGRGVIAADGAEAAQVSALGADGIEVAIGGDRYRLPATVKTR